MEQVVQALKDLHAAAAAVCQHVQQQACWGPPSAAAQLRRRCAGVAGGRLQLQRPQRRQQQAQQQQLDQQQQQQQPGGRRGLPFASLGAFGGGRGNSSKQQQAQAQQRGSGGSSKEEEDERILISEVEVVGVPEELKRVAYAALTTRPNFAYTLREVEGDLRRVFATGWFSSVVPDAEDTRDGVKLLVKVTANPELRGVVARGANVLPTAAVTRAFRKLYGRPLNFVDFSRAVERLDEWYRQRGILGQVVDFNFESGVVDLTVGEALVGSLELSFQDAKTHSPSPKGGATQPWVIRRYLTTAPGRVYSLRGAKADIDAVYSTGLFEDVSIVPQEAEDSTEAHPKVDLTINLLERKTGGLGAGTGISAAGHGSGNMPGFVGNFTYSQRNLLGLNQKLSALVELGQADSLFRLQWVDPWVAGDPNRTSRTLSVMNTRTSAAAIHGTAVDAEPGSLDGDGQGGSPGAGGITLGRLVSGVEWRRPLATNWSGMAGVTWSRSCCMDARGTPLLSDAYGAPLTFSGAANDHSLAGVMSGSYSGADGSQLGISLESAAPLHPSWLSFSRLRLRAEQPVSLGPVTLSLRGRAGTVYGDLPPYEAFPLGGTNSVRGYAEGGVGSGRHFVEGTSELRWVISKPVHGTLFMDYGSDLGSGESVIGDPAGTRGKPGSGYGYGGGIRIDSPLGPVRLEYGWSDQKRGRFHVALGYD